MFRACAKFGLENGTNEGETEAIKMYELQKLAWQAFPSVEYYQTKRI